MVRACLLVALLGACAACGDDGGSIDAPIDMTVVDIDNGACGSEVRFTGEYVDWDDDASFCGIFGAVFRVRAGASTSTTAPNGRFDVCVPDQAITLVDITPGTDDSACTTPPGPYTLPGIAVANKQVIFAVGGEFSGRGFTTARQATAIGEAINPARGHVFVHVVGTPRQLLISAAHGPTQAVATTAWEPGAIGHEVFFPNVEVGAGTTMLTTTGASVGTGAVPVVAGTITNVTIVLN
ncbi:MAG: hypothetical protein WKG01_34955 [Kofleriaceae bacterium]